MSAPAMDGISMREVDGVPAYVGDAAGPLILGLTFRVGHADEQLSRLGTTHLVEHLALHEVSASELAMNGQVEATETTFYVRGTPDEAVEFVSSVCRSLRNLPVDRLSDEARVLRVEATRRKGSIHGGLMATRFGASGYGLVAYPELGLHGPDPSFVQAWASHHFTLDNAAIWSSGELPRDLAVDLPTGRRIPPPVPAPLPYTLPAWLAERSNVIALSFLVPRGDATSVTLRLLDRRLHGRLRMGQAHSYETGVVAEPLTATLVHGMAFADALIEDAGSVRDGMITELGSLATLPPGAEEIQAAKASLEKLWTEPDSGPGLAASRASHDLCGYPIRSIEEALEDLRAITAAEVSRIARNIFDSAIVQVPAGTGTPDHRFGPLPGGSLHVPGGRTFTRTGRLDDESGEHTLVAGHEGVAYVLSPDDRATVLQSEVTAVQRWADGARTIWGRDGVTVFIHPDEWRGGQHAVATVDAWRVARELAIEMGEAAGSSYLEEVKQATAAKPKRGLFGRR